MATQAEINAAMLADAKEKYYLIITGQQASAFVDQNGERIEYSRANVTALKDYIYTLEGLVTPRTVSGPAGFFF